MRVTDEKRDADTPFGMTDLEERLRADGGEELRIALMSRLAQLDSSIGAMVDRGLARDAFRRAEAIQGAVAAARNLLAARR